MNKAFSWQSVSPKIAARWAFGFAAASLILLTILVFIEPEIDPSWRWSSEYALGRYGWMMQLVFFLWGGAALALLQTIWFPLGISRSHVGRWWLLLMSIALIGAGIFVTDPSTATTPTVSDSIHTICGMFTILTFPIMATIIARSLSRNPQWDSSQRQLFWVTLLTWAGQLAFWATIIASVAINRSAELGPQIPAGWPNRFIMAVTYGVWLMVVARCATLAAQHDGPRIGN